MTENEFLLQDRLTKIKSTIEKYGEDNFYISFSGGKDSVVLSALVDMACPGNTIPRVYADTGIELNMIHDFVYDLAKEDKRIEIIKPSQPIKKCSKKMVIHSKAKYILHVFIFIKMNAIAKCGRVIPEKGRKHGTQRHALKN